ncbi:unnamed protein product [Dibothriocephalus latus]|uniref:Uncharacterized protein n=1 Tax=Dibothriocephalus latus TaxID=60516 RepID=A0A3P6RCR1_DIBLA|nr:unnamed protein product [Dibothriocephalus latus]
MMNRADQILGRFIEKGSFRRACLETQLEQALRIHTDLSDCDRLVNSLSLFCPWEATLRYVGAVFIRFALLDAIVFFRL